MSFPNASATRPSEVYTRSQEDVKKYYLLHNLRVIGFRLPKMGEYYLAARGMLIFMRRSKGNDEDYGKLLVVERIEGKAWI